MAKTSLAMSRTGNPVMGAQLNGVDRCPHCGVAAPTLYLVWASDGETTRRDGGRPEHWGAYACASCGSVTVVTGRYAGDGYYVDEMHPSERQAHNDIPNIARKYLQQAIDTLHAPDAAAVMAGSAVDAMLKDRGYENGSLYTRIDKALADNVLTQGMADWAHSVRLGSNRPRHADGENPHVSPSEAKQSVEFAEALGAFLFVLTARIERGIVAANAAE